MLLHEARMRYPVTVGDGCPGEYQKNTGLSSPGDQTSQSDMIVYSRDEAELCVAVSGRRQKGSLLLLVSGFSLISGSLVVDPVPISLSPAASLPEGIGILIGGRSTPPPPPCSGVLIRPPFLPRSFVEKDLKKEN